MAPELVLQHGRVVNAQVLKVLSADLVRIAIASLSIDVATEIPLQQGQNLQLAVTQTKDGIRLAMVGQGGDAGSLGDAVTLSPDALAEAPVNRPAILTPKSALTPLERAAVSAAAQVAVTEQDSLAPLFANLGAAVSSSNLPPKLQAAIAQVLAQQTSLDQNLGGGDIKTTFQKSGIFLEASLAAGSISRLRCSCVARRCSRHSAAIRRSRRHRPRQHRRARRRRRPPRPPSRALYRRRRSAPTSRKSCCRRLGCRLRKTPRCLARPGLSAIRLRRRSAPDLRPVRP